jgi:ferredoxin-NADP reductase
MGRGPLPWRTGSVVEIRRESAGVATIALDVPGWPGHLAGQHVDLRLTSEDGYQAQRSYSIASPSGTETLDLTVEYVQGGEVSPFLLGDLVVGDTLEVKGPIGGHFTWRPGDGRPLLLVAGGSGIVPLMAMLRERARASDSTPARLIYSARTLGSLIYHEELNLLAAHGSAFSVTYTLTREQAGRWTGHRRRVDRAMLEASGFSADMKPLAFVCGPTPLVEQVATDLLGLGYQEDFIKTERFGPTGEFEVQAR